MNCSVGYEDESIDEDAVNIAGVSNTNTYVQTGKNNDRYRSNAEATKSMIKYPMASSQ